MFIGFVFERDRDNTLCAMLLIAFLAVAYICATLNGCQSRKGDTPLDQSELIEEVHVGSEPVDVWKFHLPDEEKTCLYFSEGLREAGVTCWDSEE